MKAIVVFCPYFVVVVVVVESHHTIYKSECIGVTEVLGQTNDFKKCQLNLGTPHLNVQSRCAHYNEPLQGTSSFE